MALVSRFNHNHALHIPPGFTMGARGSRYFALVLGLFVLTAAAKEPSVAYPLRVGTPVILIVPDDPSAAPPDDPDARTYEIGGSYFVRDGKRGDQHPISPVWEKVDVDALETRLRAVVIDGVSKYVVTGARPVPVQAPWSITQSLANTRDSEGVYVAVYPSVGFGLDLEEIGARVHFWVMRPYRSVGGKPKWLAEDRSEVSFQYRLPDRHKQEYVGPERFWAGMDDAHLTAMLKDSIDEVGRMIAYQFSPEGIAEQAGGKSKVKDCHGVKTRGHVVKTEADRCWYRPFANFGEPDDLAGVRQLDPSEIPEPAPSTPLMR